VSGLVRVVWTLGDTVVKDETVPHDLTGIDEIADTGTFNGIPVEVRFIFDPPVTCPAATTADAEEGRP
jgi:hypothetical protein